MPTFGCQKTSICVCLHQGLKDNSLYMSTPGFPKSCYLYAYVWVANVYISGSLKHSMMNMTISGFLKMPLSIFVYVCHKRWPSVYAYIKVPRSAAIYRVSQQERSIFWEVIVSVILSKKLYMNMCSIPNGFQDRAI